MFIFFLKCLYKVKVCACQNVCPFWIECVCFVLDSYILCSYSAQSEVDYQLCTSTWWEVLTFVISEDPSQLMCIFSLMATFGLLLWF